MCAWYVTHCRTSAFVYLHNYSFVIFENVSSGSHAELSRVWRCIINVSNWFLMFQDVSLMNKLGVTSSLRVPHIKRFNFSFSAAMGHSCLSLTSPWNRHKRMRTKFTQNTTWGWLRVRQMSCKNQRTGIIPVCRLLLDSQRDNTVCSWVCDECNLRDVLVGSTLWLSLPINWVDLVFRCLPNTNISMQSESTSLTSLPHFPSPPVLLGDRPDKVWTCYEVGQLSCAPINTLLSVTFPRCNSRLWCLWGLFFLSVDIRICTNQLREHFLLCHHTSLLTCAARWVHPRNTWSGGDVGSSKSPWFCNVAHMIDTFWFCPAFFFVVNIHWQEEIVFYDDGKGTPILGLLSVLLQSECSQVFCLMRVQPTDDQKDCAPAVHNLLVSLLSVIWSHLLPRMK